jgi:hypothetical protein
MTCRWLKAGPPCFSFFGACPASHRYDRPMSDRPQMLTRADVCNLGVGNSSLERWLWSLGSLRGRVSHGRSRAARPSCGLRICANQDGLYSTLFEPHARLRLLACLLPLKSYLSLGPVSYSSSAVLPSLPENISSALRTHTLITAAVSSPQHFAHSSFAQPYVKAGS